MAADGKLILPTTPITAIRPRLPGSGIAVPSNRTSLRPANSSPLSTKVSVTKSSPSQFELMVNLMNYTSVRRDVKSCAGSAPRATTLDNTDGLKLGQCCQRRSGRNRDLVRAMLRESGLVEVPDSQRVDIEKSVQIEGDGGIKIRTTKTHDGSRSEPHVLRGRAVRACAGAAADNGIGDGELRGVVSERVEPIISHGGSCRGAAAGHDGHRQ